MVRGPTKKKSISKKKAEKVTTVVEKKAAKRTPRPPRGPLYSAIKRYLRDQCEVNVAPSDMPIVENGIHIVLEKLTAASSAAMLTQKRKTLTDADITHSVGKMFNPEFASVVATETKARNAAYRASYE